MIEKEGLEKDGMRLANPTPSSSPITNPTATHTRSRRKPPSSPIVMSSLRLHKEQIRSVGSLVPLDLWVSFAINITIWERERERERESFWQNERESWTDFLKKSLFLFFFILLSLITFFLYNIYNMTRPCGQKWWREYMIGCLVGT